MNLAIKPYGDGSVNKSTDIRIDQSADSGTPAHASVWPKPVKLAEYMTLQSFANCYFREFDAGVWHHRDRWGYQHGHDFGQADIGVLELCLAAQQQTLAFNISFRSQIGPHRLQQVFGRNDGQLDWRPLDTLTVLQRMIAEIYAAPNHRQAGESKRLELSARVLGSIEVLSGFLQQRRQDERLDAMTFIDSEQSLLFGHWLHPSPKSRQGMHDWHHPYYSPELGGQFQLHYFVAQRALVEEQSLWLQATSDLLHQRLWPELHLGADDVLLPVHPLQAEWLRHQAFVRQWLRSGELQDRGAAGPWFSATSSVRTVYCAELDFMLKLSLPVKITNSRRINQHHELEAGLCIGRLLRVLQLEPENCGFEFVRDPAYITLKHPVALESGFEVIVRENPFAHAQARGRQQLSVAALVQEPVRRDGRSRLRCLVETLSARETRSLEAVSHDWFQRYWHCAIEPLIRLYDQHGLALEAHQQNSLLDVTNGYPETYFYRDNQGFYLAESRRGELVACVPELEQLQAVFYPDAMICQRFTYYLIVNQLFGVIHRLAADGLNSESQLLARASQWLNRLLPSLHGPARPLVRSLLLEPQLPCKGNLATRVEDVDELTAELEMAIYTQMHNPLLLSASDLYLHSDEADIFPQQERSHVVV